MRTRTTALTWLAAVAVVCTGLPACSSGGGSPGTGASLTARVRQVSIAVGSPPLHGTLTLPAGAGPFPAVVLVSGSGPNDQDETDGPNNPLRDIALGLAAHGVASLRYDKRTHDYPSSVQTSSFTPTQEYVPDALAAIALLDRQPAVDSHRIVVLGHSQGGTYAPLIAAHAPSVAGVVLLAASTERTVDAVLREARYLATLPGQIGASNRQAIPGLQRLTTVADDPTTLQTLHQQNPSTPLLSGTGPAYFLAELQYQEVATARAIAQPILIIQGDRDYQIPLTDFHAWVEGLAGRPGVTTAQIPLADHLFLDGTGQPTPAEYQTPGHVDPKVAATIASWIHAIHRTS